MYHPTTRVLTVLELLQTYHRLSSKEIAERLEVDRRTVRRYVTMLQDLGIPIDAERGRYGGYHLRPGYKLPPLMLTNDEALAVNLGLMVTRRTGLGIASAAAESALAKISRVLPTHLRDHSQAIEQTVAIELPESEVVMRGEVMSALTEAALRTQRVKLNYRSWRNDDTEREFDPYGLAYLQTRWYAVGYCHLRQDLRMFRVDRVLDVTILPQDFDRPPDFDTLTYATHSLATMPGYWTVEAIVDLPLESAHQHVPPTKATLEEVHNGQVLVRFTTDNLDDAAHFLVGLRCRFTILTPPELRDSLRRLADRIMGIADEGEVVVERAAEVGGE